MAMMLARTNVAARAAPGVVARPTVVVRPVRAPQAYKNIDASDVNEKLTEVAKVVQTKWEQTEDKPAAVAVTAGAVLLLITASSVADTIDKIPIVNDLIKLVGVGVSGWFIWRFLVFGPDREELVSNIKSFLKRVYGA